MKRLGIFFFYEKNGDVDDFITYYLADLNKNLTELVVVCNGKLSEQGRAAFSQFTDNIIVRENKGLDVWAYKTALDSYGWAKLSEFDEIVMTNSTLMGPVRPLKEMFDAMWENQDLDSGACPSTTVPSRTPSRASTCITICPYTSSLTSSFTASALCRTRSCRLTGTTCR